MTVSTATTSCSTSYLANQQQTGTEEQTKLHSLFRAGVHTVGAAFGSAYVELGGSKVIAYYRGRRDRRNRVLDLSVRGFMDNSSFGDQAQTTYPGTTVPVGRATTYPGTTIPVGRTTPDDSRTTTPSTASVDANNTKSLRVVRRRAMDVLKSRVESVLLQSLVSESCHTKKASNSSSGALMLDLIVLQASGSCTSVLSSSNAANMMEMDNVEALPPVATLDILSSAMTMACGLALANASVPMLDMPAVALSTNLVYAEVAGAVALVDGGPLTPELLLSVRQETDRYRLEMREALKRDLLVDGC
ncbi:unnamed protein product [Amoebophrya sp. A25]|nr:unnamed protein product [Amoebophrya sp. A25]|eukprot:GSA25T00006980001.1